LPARPAGPYVRLTVSRHVIELEEAKASLTEFRGLETYIERCRKRIPSFVDENFSLRQTWILQRPTLWRDLACAPVNSVWALPHLLVHKAAEATERVGYPQLARWDRSLPAGIKTGYQREIERRICKDLLECDREDLPAPMVNLLDQFSSGRAIVSDFFGTLLTLATSWAMLGSASLSLTSIAHGVARKSAHDRAASRFFLGRRVGSAFYRVFPPAVHESTVWTIVVGLGAALTIGAMACTILSDPIRKFLGFHRHRLEVLVDDVERELIVLSHKRIKHDLHG
jgi:hypothetical protein